MELKKYVLTIDNHILDVSKGCIYANGHVSKFILKDNVVYSQYDESYDLQICYKIKKTSDNILDLVEVGDLVEIENSVYFHKVFEQTYKGLNNQVLPYIYMNVHIESQYPLKDVNREVIKAIYKRQTNGDYKRYEVVNNV